MPAKKKNTVKEWFDTLFYGGLIAIIFRSFLMEPFNIPSGSMIPSLHVGDHIFVQKWHYGYSRYSFPFGSWNLWNGRFWAAHEPKVGDIVVFRKPGDNIEYVKRLIGLPGDTIQMTNGRLYINGQMVERKNPRRYIIANMPKLIRSIGYSKTTNEGKFISIKGNEVLFDNKPADFNYTIEYRSDCSDDVPDYYEYDYCAKHAFEYYERKTKELCGKQVNHHECSSVELKNYRSEIEQNTTQEIFCKNMYKQECGVFELKEYTEVLPNGIEHSIIESSDNELNDTTREFIVPENHYFFMGDNRDNSGDSRAIGPVPRDNLLGRAWFVWYSHNYYSPMLFFWNWGDKMRWDRFGIGKTKLGMTKAE